MTSRTKREYLRDLVADKSRWAGHERKDKERAFGFLSGF
jgi:hypothetical protein